MKKYEVALSALLVCGACYAAQDTTLSQAEVRDPRRLETILEANSTDAESRLAAAEAGTSIGLASNKVFIGSALGKAFARTLSGLFSVNTNGVASATSSGLALTNTTVSGGALSGVSLVVTNASNGAVSGVGTSLTQMANSLVVTNASVGGAALSGVSLVMTNASITPALIVTNVTFTSQIITNVYDLQTNIYTIYTGAAMETATLTLTKETGTPSVSSPTITLENGSAVQSVSLNTGNITPTLTLQTGTPAVSTVALSLQTSTFVKP